MKRIESWHHTKSSALSEAKLRKLPIVMVKQPKGRKSLYAFGKRNSKKYYVVTSAPKTLIESLRGGGVQARVLSR